MFCHQLWKPRRRLPSKVNQNRDTSSPEITAKPIHTHTHTHARARARAREMRKENVILLFPNLP